jgi:hypothetical protein
MDKSKNYKVGYGYNVINPRLDVQRSALDQFKNCWPVWEERFKEPVWQVKKAVEWVSIPAEWSFVPSENDILKDMSSYKQNMYTKITDAIYRKKLKATYDERLKDYLVFPLQILIFLEGLHFRLPKPCSAFLETSRRQSFAESIPSSKKYKKPPPLSEGAKPIQHKIQQNNDYLELVKAEIERLPPESYDEFFTRGIIRAFLWTDAKGNPWTPNRSTLQKKVSKFMPAEATKAGRR